MSSSKAQARSYVRSRSRRKSRARARNRQRSQLNRSYELPSLEELEEELNRIRYRRRFSSIMMNTVFILVVVAAVAVLIAMLWMPVLRIYGTSMSPTMNDGEIVVSVKENRFEPGEIVAFYYNNKILVKRVVAQAGDWVDIDESGNVYINNVLLNEPYIPEKAFGDCNIDLPYQVPDGKVFVIGDNRATSIDSRNTAVGCVAEEQLVGELIFRVWPLKQLGRIHAFDDYPEELIEQGAANASGEHMGNPDIQGE